MIEEIICSESTVKRILVMYFSISAVVL